MPATIGIQNPVLFAEEAKLLLFSAFICEISEICVSFWTNKRSMERQPTTGSNRDLHEITVRVPNDRLVVRIPRLPRR